MAHTTSYVSTYKEVINEVNHIFRENDIRKMFEFFRENNFRENPICKYVL